MESPIRVLLSEGRRRSVDAVDRELFCNTRTFIAAGW